jgi:hypothetical protein
MTAAVVFFLRKPHHRRTSICGGVAGVLRGCRPRFLPYAHIPALAVLPLGDFTNVASVCLITLFPFPIFSLRCGRLAGVYFRHLRAKQIALRYFTANPTHPPIPFVETHPLCEGPWRCAATCLYRCKPTPDVHPLGDAASHRGPRPALQTRRIIVLLTASLC